MKKKRKIKIKIENVFEDMFTAVFPRLIHFSIESDVTKPYDILKMTGKQTNQEDNDGSENNN